MSDDPPPVFPVSAVVGAIKALLNDAFAAIWVEGEISGVSKSGPGHVYLTLKDDTAQMSAVLWRNAAMKVPFEIKNGQKVQCLGYVDVYPVRGTMQLIVQQIKPVGVGAIELALRQLKEKLEREGLFDPALKKPLPKYPRRVAVVTSPTGAAIRDFLQVLTRRWTGVDVMIVPTRVQGPGSDREIAEAIESVSRFSDPPDVVIVTRGGGSQEDLFSFSSEAVCRAIHACRVPVVSGVGHEIDVSLADLVADVRALTPSEAAELLVPDQQVFATQLNNLSKRMEAALLTRLDQAQQRLAHASSHPLLRQPQQLIDAHADRLVDLANRMHQVIEREWVAAESQLSRAAGRLDAISPLAVLARGYSLTTIDGEPVVDASEVNFDQLIRTQLAQGSLVSRVQQIQQE